MWSVSPVWCQTPFPKLIPEKVQSIPGWSLTRLLLGGSVITSIIMIFLFVDNVFSSLSRYRCIIRYRSIEPAILFTPPSCVILIPAIGAILLASQLIHYFPDNPTHGRSRPPPSLTLQPRPSTRKQWGYRLGRGFQVCEVVTECVSEVAAN